MYPIANLGVIIALQSIELPDDAAAMMRDKLYRTMYVVNLVTQIGILIGCSFIILSTILFCCYMKKSEPVDQNKIGKLNI